MFRVLFFLVIIMISCEDALTYKTKCFTKLDITFANTDTINYYAKIINNTSVSNIKSLIDKNLAFDSINIALPKDSIVKADKTLWWYFESYEYFESCVACTSDVIVDFTLKIFSDSLMDSLVYSCYLNKSNSLFFNDSNYTETESDSTQIYISHYKLEKNILLPKILSDTL